MTAAIEERPTAKVAVSIGAVLPTAHDVCGRLGIDDENTKRKIRRCWYGRAGIDPELLVEICDAYDWDEWRTAVALRELARRREQHRAGVSFDHGAGR